MPKREKYTHPLTKQPISSKAEYGNETERDIYDFTVADMLRRFAIPKLRR
jgi:hypothetical protein